MPNTQPQTPLGPLWHTIQSWLFPMLEDEIGALDEQHRQFVAVCELCAPQDHMAAYRWCGNGCPPSDRLALCKAYIWTSLTAISPSVSFSVPPAYMTVRLPSPWRR
jgi:hypothetical protein